MQPGPFAPLRERNYRVFFIGSVVSYLGSFCQGIAQSVLVYRLSQSTFLVGVVNFAQFAAVPVLAPWAGTLGDRLNRRRIILACQVAALVVAATLTALSAAGQVTVPVAAVLAALLGLTSAFSLPITRVFATSLVSERNLGRAVNLDSVAVNLARAAGPVLGSVIVHTASETWAFGFNAFSYLALIAALLIIGPRTQAPATSRPRVRDGLVALRRQPRLAALLLVVSACAVGADPTATLGPETAASFGGGERLAGLILGAFGAGGVIGALVAGAEADRNHRKIARLMSVLVAGLALFAIGGWLPLVLGGAALAGFGYLTSQTRSTAMLIRSTSDTERGRVMALWTIAFFGVRPIASLIDGAIGRRWGVEPAALAMAVPACVAIAVSWRLDRVDQNRA